MLESQEPYFVLSSGKTITGTLVWYYFICKREVWLMSHEITPDEDHEALEVGRAVHEIFYSRMIKEFSMEGMKVDILKRGERTICEIKTSSRFVRAARFQLLYYLYRLKEDLGVDFSGWILVPRERKRIKVVLDETAQSSLLQVLQEIKQIADSDKPPPPVKNPFCRKCAYRDFCWC